MDAIRWVLDQLQKYGLFANLKKSRFHQDKVQFLGYIVSAQGIQMEEEKIKAIRAWPEPQSIRDFQVFLGFANFYRRFIKGFSKIAILLTSMLKTTAPSTLAGPAYTRIDKNEFDTDGDGGVSGGRVNDRIENLSTNTKVKKSSRTDFLISGAKKAFNRLRKAFTETLILRHFDPKCHIQIETNALGYAIGEIFSQMAPNQHFSDHVTHKNPNSEIG